MITVLPPEGKDNSWCGWCNKMKPVVDSLVRMGYIIERIDANDPRAQQYNVSGFPTFIFLEGGREVGRSPGHTSEEVLKNRTTHLDSIEGTCSLSVHKGSSADKDVYTCTVKAVDGTEISVPLYPNQIAYIQAGLKKREQLGIKKTKARITFNKEGQEGLLVALEKLPPSNIADTEQKAVQSFPKNLKKEEDRINKIVEKYEKQLRERQQAEREEKIKNLQKQMQVLGEDDPLRRNFEQELEALRKNP